MKYVALKFFKAMKIETTGDDEPKAPFDVDGVEAPLFQ